MPIRRPALSGAALPILALAGCGGSGGSVQSTPSPPISSPAPAPSPIPAPAPSPTNFNTAEYQRSNAAVQAQALAAYNAGASGAGVTVGVIDGGVATASAEFAGRISPLSADLAGARGIVDEGGHGTAVSDVLLGAKNDSGIQGVAFGATLLVARTDTPGSCASTEGCVHDDGAIARGLDLAVTAGARVVNISLGGAPASSTLRDAISRATLAGVVIVISAGNAFEDHPSTAVDPDPLAQIAGDPVAHGLVLVAGAVDSNHSIASFSNRAGADAAYYLTALGVRVRSIDQTGMPLLYSGTSFSAPAVAGAIALLAQAFPSLTPAQLVDLVLRTATDLGAAGVDAVYGHGELNLAAAFAPQGQMSLGGSAMPVSLVSNAALSAPMGDAGGSGRLMAVAADSYGRDYRVDLTPTLGRAPSASRLASGLATGLRSAGVSAGATTLAVSVSRRGAGPLLFSGQESGQARVIAGSVAMMLGGNLQATIGAGTGAEILTAGPRPKAASFLAAVDDDGLGRVPRVGFAVRRKLGIAGVSVAAESGDLRLWERGEAGPRSDGWRRHGYAALSIAADGRAGPIMGRARLARLMEADTVLGASFGSALGGGGATTWFADIAFWAEPLAGWRIGGSLKRGWTQVSGGPVRDASVIFTRSLTLDLSRGPWSLRWAEPLRVTRGALRLTGLGAPDRLDLSPAGHERDVEAVYARPAGPGMLTFNSYWRRQPGNYQAAPADLGFALRYGLDF